MNTSPDYDVIVVGAGISGLGAALKLKDAGLNVLVLEKESRPGGRISTDRIDGFVIDRGATILGAGFHSMKRLVKRLKLQGLAQNFNFTFGLQDTLGLTKFRRARVDDVLLSKKVGLHAKLAMLRFGTNVVLNSWRLGHGLSVNAGYFDDISVEEYMKRIGGNELFNKILLPGLNGPMGGYMKSSSRLILFQTFRNILLKRTWAMRGGMDHIINAMAAQLNIRLNAIVGQVIVESQTSVRVVANGDVLTARSVIIALPGKAAAKLCGQLPGHVRQLLEDTEYGEMLSAHVMLSRPTETTCAGYGIAAEIGNGYEIELEHNRVSKLCDEGKGMASVYMWNEDGNYITEKSDDDIKTRAENIIRTRFPECANHIIGTHIVRWKDGIAHFPPGRLRQLAGLRREMSNWKLPVQLCGDYLDGIASESALVTGEIAAANIIVLIG